MTTDPLDQKFMAMALGLAARGLGRVAPNPAVGCVIADDQGRIVGRGWTQAGGRPHAETEALARAGATARGATVYVSLEPCAHHGKTPPCAEALIAAGVARVVAATVDPDPRVGGRGLELLKAAGIAVTAGVMDKEARALNAGFIRSVTSGMPLVTLKLATSLDGRIATTTGDSQWITGAAARARGHLLRASHDAILVGRGTVAADDPELTCRLPGLEDRSPVRVVLDSQLSIAPATKLVQTAKRTPTWILAAGDADAERERKLAAQGVDVIRVAGDRPGLDPSEALRSLGGRGITRVLIEGGAAVATCFLRARLIDHLIWFRAPRVIGGDGRAAIEGLAVDQLSQACGLVRRSIEPVGEDVVERYDRDG